MKALTILCETVLHKSPAISSSIPGDTVQRRSGWKAVTLQQTPETRLLPDVVGARLVCSATNIVALGRDLLLPELFVCKPKP